MTEAYTCPFCNSLFPRDQAPVTSRGPSCPRCGEPLPAQGPVVAPVPQSTVAPEPVRKPRRANLVVGVIVVLVMGAMAWIGLELAMQTKDYRRRNDFKSVPGEWAALNYLPADCNVLAAIDLGELTGKDEFEAKRLLDDPRPPLVQKALAQLEDWTGLKLEALDHVVLGAAVNVKQPRLTLVVATQKPYDPAVVVQKLKAEKIGEHHSMPVYQFSIVAAEGRLWCPEQKVMILSVRLDSFKKGDYSEFVFPPRKDNKDLPGDMRILLESKRVKKDGLVWVAGHGDWTELLKLKNGLDALQGKLSGDSRELETLAKVTTFALSLDRDLTFHAELFAGNEANMASLKNQLESGIKKLKKGDEDDRKLTVVVPPPGTLGPDAFWVSVQRRFSVEEIRNFLAAAGKK